MNNQSRLHPHYTLPGVMHYLQTEFTKNERDRITWELERAEMKARIAQLEGENKDLHYRLMKLDSQASGATRETETSDVSGDDLSDLLKSKMAVQESVKEIIYLFKSPEVASRFGSLNEERDSLHELQNLNLNQDLQSVKTQDELPVGHLSEANLHQASIKPEAAYVAGTNPHDANSDAATVVLGSDSETNEWHDTRRRRSSSLFAPAKVLPVEPTKNGIDESKDPEAGSSLFRNDGTDKSESRAVLQLKSFEDQIISYSEDGRMELWFIDSQLRISEKPVQSFQVVSSNFLDYYWFDSKRFLVFDDQGVKLYATRSTTPLDSRDVFKELNFNISNVVEHDYINGWFLFVSAKTIQLLEVSVSDSSPKEELAMGKSYTIDGERVILSARFGMTEKSLIVLYSDPCELVIYNYQGKILQRVDISKQLPSTGEKTRPSLILNKRSSKLLIGLADRVLVYSFDRKKVILNETLDSQPTNIIFKTVKNCMLYAYNDDIIEIRRLKDFKTILRVPAGEHDESKKVKKITSLECASVNSKTLIVTGFEDGAVTAQRKPDLIDD